MAERKRPQRKKRQVDISENYKKDFKKFEKETYGAMVLVYSFSEIPHEISADEIQKFTMAYRDPNNNIVQGQLDAVTEVTGMIFDGKEYFTKEGAEEGIKPKLVHTDIIGYAGKWEVDSETEEVTRTTYPVYLGVKFLEDKPPVGSKGSATFSGFLNILNLPIEKKTQTCISDGKDSITLDLEAITQIESLKVDGTVLDESQYKLGDSHGITMQPELGTTSTKYELFKTIKFLDPSILKEGAEISASYKGFSKADKVSYFSEDYKTSVNQFGNIRLDLPLYLNIEKVQIGNETYSETKDIKEVLEFKEAIGSSARRKYEKDFPENVEIIAERAYSVLSVKDKNKYPEGTPLTITYTGVKNGNYLRNDKDIRIKVDKE
jgi:hypothetical protein